MLFGSLLDLAFAVLVLSLMVGAVFLTRWKLTPQLREDAESIAAVSAAIVAVYGLILGLTLAAAWERYQRAEETMNNELNGMFALSHMAYNWRGEGGEDLQQSIVDYGRTVYANELTGEDPNRVKASEGRLALEKVVQQLANITAGPGGQLAVTDPAWTVVVAIDNARGSRLMLSRQALPTQFWVVLYVVAALSLVSLVLIHPKSRALHVAISIGAAILIVVAIILLRDLDAPLEGASTIDFESYNTAVDILQKSLSGQS
ncbi:MAG: DUF4239 domain-containing protein [Thermomicrobiales bacterium]